MERLCECGCGAHITGTVRGEPRRFVSGHNLRTLKRTEQHRQHIADAQRQSWANKRKRFPLGSTYTDFSGYVREKVVAGTGRWKLQHVLVMEGLTGRLLERGEIVHHINGVRTDNRPENLFLCRSHAHHMEVERSLARVFRELLEAGVARFNPDLGCYERAP